MKGKVLHLYAKSMTSRDIVTTFKEVADADKKLENALELIND